MADSSAKYHVIPSSDLEAHQADANEAGVGAEDPHSTRECQISAETLTKWTYFLLGCAILLPWNALINGTSFFLSRLADSPFYQTFNPYLSSVYMLVILGAQFYSTVTSKQIPQSSPLRRTFASIITMIVFVTSLCLSTFVQGTPSTFFSFVLVNASSLAVASGYLCTAVFAGAALLGPSYLQTVISGQAAVAVAVSAVQVISSMISLWGTSPKSISAEVTTADREDHHPEEMAARIFFGVSALFLGVTLVTYTRLTRQPFYKSVAGVLERQRKTARTDDSAGPAADDCRNPLTDDNSRVYRVFKQNLIFVFSVAYAFMVTLAVYPAITVRVQPVHSDTHPLLFASIHFLVFNTGDLIGRYSCSFPRLLVWSANKILAMALLRTLFIPLILLCNVQRPVTTLPVSPVISSDALFMFILLMMGYTNGYVSTLATLAVSSLEHNPRLQRREDVDVAATLGGFFGIVGLAAGALASFGVQAMT